MLRALRKASSHSILRKAIKILTKRGKATGNAIHPYTGSVDIWGALCLAGGAKEAQLGDSIEEMHTVVPRASRGAVIGAYEALSAYVGEDAATWGDQHELEEIVSTMKLVADMVEQAF